MVSRIIVKPDEVRCGGNIVSPKSGLDYGLYGCTLTSGTDTVNGQTLGVFLMDYQAQATVSLSLSSSSVTVGTVVTCTATVLDTDSEPVEGASVVFKVNGTQIGTPQTTNSSGVATYSYTTDTVGSLSVTAVYGSISSSASPLTVNKITSTISLAAASATVTVGSDVSLSGTLSVGSGKTVTIYQGGTSIGTVTTVSGGAFSKTVSGLAVGTYSFTASYAGDDTHTNVTSSAVSVTVQAAPSYDSISVSADKSILSYADGQKATLYAQLLDSGSSASVSGVTVTFKQGTTTLGTADTDATGKATLTDGYTSAGVGDISITATDGTFVSESFVIHDYLYAPKLDGSETIHQISGTTTISNGEMSGGSAYLTTAWDNTIDWELTFKVKFSSNSCGFYLIKPNETSRDNNELLQSAYNGYNYWNGSLLATLSNRSLSTNTWHNVTIVKNSSGITTTINNVSQSINQGITTLNSICLGVDTWSGSATIKDIIVKPL